LAVLVLPEADGGRVAAMSVATGDRSRTCCHLVIPSWTNWFLSRFWNVIPEVWGVTLPRPIVDRLSSQSSMPSLIGLADVDRLAVST
jgi:hypothetical protein